MGQLKNKKNKIPKEISQEISKSIIKNLLIAVCITIYFVVLNVAFLKMDQERVVNDIKVFAGFFLVVGIIFIEKAYKEDSGSAALSGIEFLFLSLHSLSIMHIIKILNYDLKLYLRICTYAFLIYYVLKSVILYTKARNNFLKSLNDINEIVKKEEPVKKEAQRRTKTSEKNKNNENIKNMENTKKAPTREVSKKPQARIVKRELEILETKSKTAKKIAEEKETKPKTAKRTPKTATKTTKPKTTKRTSKTEGNAKTKTTKKTIDEKGTKPKTAKRTSKTTESVKTKATTKKTTEEKGTKTKTVKRTSKTGETKPKSIKRTEAAKRASKKAKEK